MTSPRHVTIGRLSELTGLSVRAVEHMIAKGVWAEGRHYRRRNGRIYIDIAAYDLWVEKGN